MEQMAEDKLPTAWAMTGPRCLPGEAGDTGGSDSGVSGRVYQMMAQEMSDTRNRGKIVWILREPASRSHRSRL